MRTYQGPRQRVNVSGCQVLDGQPYGIYVEDSSYLNITGTSVLETRAEKKTRAAIRLRGAGVGNLLASNTLGGGTKDFIERDDAFEAKLGDNLLVDGAN
jgi:hypothetical protein